MLPPRFRVHSCNQAEVTQIFAKVNASFEEAGDDGNEMELTYEEFAQV